MDEDQIKDDKSLQRIKSILDAKGPLPVYDPKKPETVPVNLFSGGTRRLEFHDQKPGFVYWICNDDKGGRSISDALDSGWRFTERKDVKLNAAVTPRNSALGSYVRYHVGTDEAGGTMYGYLMEMPEELYIQQNYGPGSREEYHQMLIKQIHEGTIGQKPEERRISANRPHPGGSANFLPPISGGVSVGRMTK